MANEPMGMMRSLLPLPRTFTQSFGVSMSATSRLASSDRRIPVE